MIEVEDLVFEYPTVRALDHVSLAVAPRAIAALVGPNGAGKTTLLRCLAALERPYAGRVRVDGLDVVREPRRVHARLGYLPDFYGLYDDLTVRQCLLFAARARGLPPMEAEEAARDAAARVDLADRFGSTAETLSRGLRQRLAIAQAIVHRPKVLLLDEPASGLDPQARRSLSHLLRTLRDEGMTLVVSSHILAELEDYCTEMIVIEKGRLVSGGIIRVETGEGERARVRIVVTAPEPPLAPALGDDPAVEIVASGPTSAEVLIAGGAEARAALLKRLVGQGFAVAEFALVRRSLEDAYFSEVDAAAERRR